ncbi:MAG: hypothetical protein Q8L48_11725 [Archangium sp.]|nr:hypothetical protein [Archangium sp.]
MKLKLGEHKRRAFSQAKYLTLLSAGIQWVLLGAALFSAFAGGLGAPYLGLIAFIGPVINFALKDRSRYHYGIGDRARRLQVLDDGLGRAPAEADMLDLADTETILPALDPVPLTSEFTSDLPPGPRRLAHITQEAAYYTRSRATFAARLYFALTIIGIFVTVIGLLLLIQFPLPQVAGSDTTAQNWARAAATLLVFFAAGSFAEKWRAFDSLAKAAASTFARCDTLRRTEPSELDVVLTVASYDTALGRAPAIPTTIYLVGRKRLHAAWTALMMPKTDPVVSSGTAGAK